MGCPDRRPGNTLRSDVKRYMYYGEQPEEEHLTSTSLMDERMYTETRSPVTLNNTQCSEILSSTTHREKHWQSAAVPGNDNHRAKLCTNQLSPKGRKKPKARTKSKATQFKPSAKNSVKGKKPPSSFPYQGEDVGQIVGPSSAFTPVRKSRPRESVAFQDNVFDTVSAAFSSPVQYLPTMTIPLYSIASSLYEGINGSDSLDHMWSQGDHLSPSFYNENFQRAGESDEYLQAALEEQGGFDSSENGNWLSEIPCRTYTPLATPCCFAPQVHKQFLSNKNHSRAKVASAVLPFNIETLLDASNCERDSGSDHNTSRLHGPIAEVKKPGNDESIDAEGGSSNSDFDDKMSKRRMVLDEDKMSKRRMVLDIVSSSRPLTRSCGDLHEIPIEALGLEPKSVVRTPRDPNRPRAPPKPRKKRGRGGEDGIVEVKPSSTYTMRNLNQRRMYTSRLHEAFCSLARDRYDDLYDWEMLSEAVTKAFGPMRPKRLEEAIRQLHFVIFVTIGEEGFESDDRLPGHPLSRVVKQEVVSDGAGEQNRQG